MDFNGTGLKYNTLQYNEVGNADWVNPNLDTAYIESWIAGELQVENSTVRSHISSILSKLALENRTQAALYAVEMGLIQPKGKS